MLTAIAQCSAATNHLITNAVINITSDIMIILIPMPIFLKSQLPLKRKAVLIGVFALGAFTVSFNFNLTQLKPRLTRTDSLRHPQQVLQFQRTLRLKLDVLVHPRILHRHHNRQPSLHLDPPPPHLQARLIQRLDIRQEHKQPLQSIPLKLHQPSLRRALPSPRGA
jgi:hypothetical protein